MLLTLVSAVVLALPLCQQTEDPARLVPPNALVFLGTHSVQAADLASKNSAMRQILDEAEMKAFLQKPVNAAQLAVDAMIKESGIAEASARKVSLTDMLSGSGDGLALGKLFLALTHVSLPAPADGEKGVPDVGLVVGVELLNADDLALVKALWSRIPAPEETANHGGREYLQKSVEDGVSFSLAFLGNLAVVSMSDKTLFDVMDRFDGRSKDAGSLADTAEYRKLITTAGGLQPGASTSLVRVSAIIDLAKAALSFSILAHEEMRDKAPKILMAIDNLGVSGLQWAGAVSYRGSDGKVISTAVTTLAKGAKGLVPSMIAGGQPLDTTRLSKVPGNSLSLAAGSLDWLGEAYDFVMTTFESIDPEAYAEVTAQIKESMGDADLRHDLFANVHGSSVSYSLPGEGFPGTPTTVMRIGLNDPPAFAKTIQALVEAVSTKFLEGQPVTLKESDHEGHRFFELDVSRTPLAMAMLQPAFAFDGNELVFSVNSPKAVKSELNGNAGEGSITENKELMDFVEQLGKKGSLRSVSFSDNAASFGAMYGQLAGVSQLVAGSMGDLPVDLSLLPAEGSISKHLSNSYSGEVADPDGTTFVTRGVSQFQLGDFLPLLITGGALAAASIGGDEAAAAEAREVSPEEKVQEDLTQISAGMTVFKISEGKYPGAIVDLVRPLADYPDGCLGSPDLPVDPWGNAYSFTLNQKGKPFLWSSGPDGVDQQGTGDDIAKK